jgi:hypothetical protein
MTGIGLHAKSDALTAKTPVEYEFVFGLDDGWLI